VIANRRHYGGLVVHLGVVIIAVALAASQNYTTRHEARLQPGASETVAGYTVTYLGTATRTSAQKVTLSARLRVLHADTEIGVLEPSLATFPGGNEAIGTPAVRPGPVTDLYLTLISSPDSTGTVTVGVFVNPLVSWLWVGGLVMVLGSVIAGWPARRRPRRTRPEPLTAARPDPAPALIGGRT
jgi:cytochrome c-type biogenesis protein CcmF